MVPPPASCTDQVPGLLALNCWVPSWLSVTVAGVMASGTTVTVAHSPIARLGRSALVRPSSGREAAVLAAGNLG